MKTYLDVLGEISFLWWAVPIASISVIGYLLYGLIGGKWTWGGFVQVSSVVTFFVTLSYCSQSYINMKSYNSNYSTCHKQEALKAGYKMVDNECYKPYSGFIPVNESGK